MDGTEREMGGDPIIQAITNRLIAPDITRIEQKVRAGNVVRGFWGTAPTGKPHIGYLLPLVKIAECIAAGVEMTILIADSYAYLVNHDVTLEIVEFRSQYYAYLLRSILEKGLRVPSEKIMIMKESDSSFTPTFVKNKMRMSAVSTLAELSKCGLEIGRSEMLSPLLCPIHQALGEIYTRSDFQLGGIDQAGMFEYADQCLPRIGYQAASHLMTEMIPGIQPDNKMSSSASADTKIMFCEAYEHKIANAEISETNPDRNALLAILKHILFPMYDLGFLAADVAIEVVHPTDGSMRKYTRYTVLEHDLKSGLLTMAELKSLVSRTLDYILAPITQDYLGNQKWQEAEQQAYHGPAGCR